MSNHKLTQMFYERLSLQDRYLLDATNIGTFMSKFKDDAIKLIETMATYSHHNIEKPLRRGAMSKGQLIDTKLVETCILQNLLLDLEDGEGRGLEPCTGSTQHQKWF